MTTPAPIGPVSKQKFLAARNTQTDSWCRYEPVKCVLQQIKEIGFFVGAYIVLVLVATNFDFTKLPSLQQLAKFSVAFVAIGYSARLMSDVELQRYQLGQHAHDEAAKDVDDRRVPRELGAEHAARPDIDAVARRRPDGAAECNPEHHRHHNQPLPLK